MPQKLVDMLGTTTKEYPYELTYKEERADVKTTLGTLRSSYTYLKIPKDHAHMWVQGIYQLLLFYRD